jgi:hypothetical protein
VAIAGGRYPSLGENPPAVANVRVLDNRFLETKHPVHFSGRFDSILVAGNRMIFRKPGYGTAKLYTLEEAYPEFAFTFNNPHPDNKAVLIANNTIVNAAMLGRVYRHWDTPIGGEVHVVNNLLLGPGFHGQVTVRYTDDGYHPFGMSDDAPRSYGDAKAATTLTERWTFSHNWRETLALTVPPPEVSTPGGRLWSPTERDREILQKEGLSLDVQGIPASSTTHLVPVIEGIDRDPKSPAYLRPSLDSPVATAGAGRLDRALPKYVGALPPQAWDWDRTWESLPKVSPPEKPK